MDILFSFSKPLLGLAVIFIWFQVILWVIGKIGGWAHIASLYYDRQCFDGKTWRFRSIRLKFFGKYNNIVTVEADDAGMRFSLPVLFQTGHKPFFIPWSDIELSEETVFMFIWAKITLKKDPQAEIWLPQGLMNEINGSRDTCNIIF